MNESGGEFLWLALEEDVTSGEDAAILWGAVRDFYETRDPPVARALDRLLSDGRAPLRSRFYPPSYVQYLWFDGGRDVSTDGYFLEGAVFRALEGGDAGALSNHRCYGSFQGAWLAACRATLAAVPFPEQSPP